MLLMIQFPGRLGQIMRRQENKLNLQFADIVVWVIRHLPGWSFITIPLVVLLFLVVLPVPVSAQVTMNVPFQPIGTDGYVPILNTSASTVGAQTQVLLRGTDENGVTVYSTPWVEVPPAEFADGAKAALGDPGIGPSLQGLLEDSGLEVDRQAVDPDERVVDPPVDWPDWTTTGLGTCREYFGSSSVIGSNVTLSQCISLAKSYSSQPSPPTTYSFPQGACAAGQRTRAWGWLDISSVVRFDWQPAGALSCVPNEGLPTPGDRTDAIPASDEMFRELLMAQAPPSPALPNRPGRPINNYEFTTIVVNHTNIFTSITTEAASTTNDYEASGDLADVGGTKQRPSGSLGTGEGVEDLEAFCIRNPDRLLCQEELSGGGGDGMAEYCADNPNALACSEVDPSNSSIAGLEAALGSLEDAEGNAQIELDRLTDELDAYEFGDGPAVGPAPGSCPFDDVEFSLGGLTNNLDMDAVCQGLGGPVRQVVEIAGMFIAALIIIKGIS